MTNPARVATDVAGAAVTPELFLDGVSAYERTYALKAAVDLDIFTAIGDGATTVAALAERCGASERGIRMFADYLAATGFLTKTSGTYGLTPASATFLTRRSPKYMGGVLGFLTDKRLMENFEDLAGTIRRGTVEPSANTVAEGNSLWVEFARSMGSLAMPAAVTVADVLGVAQAGPLRVLDIAAGHGLYGITIALRNPRAEVTAVDWPQVLTVAMENARRVGVADRHQLVAGDAFAVDFGTGYDVALVTNFLHHFDAYTNTEFLRKIAAALEPGGRVAIVEMVPNDDRLSPPFPAMFVLKMLAGTPAGDTYTLRDLQQMLTAAGFSGVSSHPTPGPQTIVVAAK